MHICNIHREGYLSRYIGIGAGLSRTGGARESVLSLSFWSVAKNLRVGVGAIHESPLHQVSLFSRESIMSSCAGRREA